MIHLLIALQLPIFIPAGCYVQSTTASGTTYTPCSSPPPVVNYQPKPTGLPPLPASIVLPALPQNVPQPSYPTVGSVVQVTDPGKLQAALNGAVCGQAVVLQTGLTVTGNIVVPVLPSKTCPGNPALFISSSDFANDPTGKRIAQTDPVPWIVTPNSTCALKIANGAADWYIDGIGITTATPIPYGVYPILDMGDNDAVTLAMLPSNITFDRVLLTAPSPIAKGNFVQRGASFNCIGCSFINSQCWNIVNAGMDTQCLEIDNTPGPLLIANNYLEASGENIMTNTKCTPTTCAGPNGNPNGVVPAPVPSDILVIGNSFAKQLAWASQPTGCNPAVYSCYTVKDEFEVKHGQRIWVTGNVFQNTFQAAQGEFIIVNSFAAGLYVTQDLTFTNNLFLHGVSVFDSNGNGGPTTNQRVLFQNNLALDIDGAKYVQPPVPPAKVQYGMGAFGAIQNGASVTISHNTTINLPPINDSAVAFSDAPPSTNKQFAYLDNIVYGQPAANAMKAGSVIANFPAGTLWGGDLWVGDWWNRNYPAGNGSPESDAQPLYPAGMTAIASTATPANSSPCNFSAWYPQPGVSQNRSIPGCWPLDWALVGLVDFTGASSGSNPAGAALSPSSPYHCKASDSTPDNCVDPGANVSAVLAAIAGVQ